MKISNHSLEKTDEFTPQYNDQGLIPCIAQDAKTGQVLMMAWMNEEAIEKTLQTGEAYYYSRSRQKLWHKGAESGAVQKVVSIKTDCDQDCLLMKVEPQKKEDTCHTGRKTCFYRTLNDDGHLSHDDEA